MVNVSSCDHRENVEECPICTTNKLLFNRSVLSDCKANRAKTMKTEKALIAELVGALKYADYELRHSNSNKNTRLEVADMVCKALSTSANAGYVTNNAKKESI